MRLGPKVGRPPSGGSVIVGPFSSAMLVSFISAPNILAFLLNSPPHYFASSTCIFLLFKRYMCISPGLAPRTRFSTCIISPLGFLWYSKVCFTASRLSFLCNNLLLVPLHLPPVDSFLPCRNNQIKIPCCLWCLPKALDLSRTPPP